MIDDQLKLPRGGLVAMRRSGGFRFTSREVVVYKNGRVVFGDSSFTGDAKTHEQAILSDQQLAEVHHSMDKANFPNLPIRPARSNPDAYSYELVARVGRKIYSVEVTDGGLPQQLSPLVQLLIRYLSLVA